MNLELFVDNSVKPNRDMFFISKCENGLHSFYKSPYRNSNNEIVCRNCKLDSVNWDIVKERNYNNIHLVSSEIRKEWWRNFWWKIEIDELALLNANKIGLNKIYINVEKRIKNSVGKVYSFKGEIKPFKDGYQTPFSGNIIFYAQHAMATCCRFCIEYWHGIPQGRYLNENEIKYLSDVTFHYIKNRLK